MNLKELILSNIENNILEFVIDNLNYSDILRAVDLPDYNVTLIRNEEIIKDPSNWYRGFKIKHKSSTKIILRKNNEKD